MCYASIDSYGNFIKTSIIKKFNTITSSINIYAYHLLNSKLLRLPLLSSINDMNIQKVVKNRNLEVKFELPS